MHVETQETSRYVRCNKRMIIDAFILSYKRQKLLPKIIAGVRKQSMIRDIYVFHNAPSKKKIKGVYNIFSEKNFGCIARHAIAQLSNCDYAFFVDDDVEIQKDLSQQFCVGIQKYPNSILGVAGSCVDAKAHKKKLYASGGSLLFVTSYVYVDIVPGFIHLCPRKLLWSSFRYTRKSDITDMCLEDDVILNLSAQLETRIPSVVVPSTPYDYILHFDKQGVFLRGDHALRRSAVIADVLSKGWRPLLRREQYVKVNNTVLENRFMYYLNEKKINEALQKKDCEKSARFFKKCQMCSIPDHVLYGMAGVFRESRCRAKAQHIYEYIIKHGNAEYIPLALYHLGVMYMAQHNYCEAKKVLQKCLRLMPSHKKAYWLMRLTDIKTHDRNKPLKIVLGSAGNNMRRWYTTDKDVLDITNKKMWADYMGKKKADNFIAEHVFEHLTKASLKKALAYCHHYLKKNGRLRIAVPDGLFPDKRYINRVKPGGTGPGVEDHKVLYTYKTLGAVLRNANFRIELLEYWTEAGEFVRNKWYCKDGKVQRSFKYDKRNQDGQLEYTSLIIDAIKA
jgi:predicted SAM-dependent methyltransferase